MEAMTAETGWERLNDNYEKRFADWLRDNAPVDEWFGGKAARVNHRTDELLRVSTVDVYFSGHRGSNIRNYDPAWIQTQLDGGELPEEVANDLTLGLSSWVF